jgi:hypothetical protein
VTPSLCVDVDVTLVIAGCAPWQAVGCVKAAASASVVIMD